MKMIDEFSVETPGEVRVLDIFRAVPQKTHIEIEIKSPIIANWIEGLAFKDREPIKSTKWGGVYWNINAENIRFPNNAIWDPPGGEIIREGGGGVCPNISWIRHLDLATGFKIKVPFCSSAAYEELGAATADAIRFLYLQNIRKNIISLKMKEVLW